MKKTLNTSFLALSALLMVFSCAKESLETYNNEQEEPSQKPVFETRTVTLKIEDTNPETRLDIASNGKVGWEVGDKILIHGEYINKTGYSVVVTLDGVTNTISGDKKSATITLTLGDGSAAGTVKPYIHMSGDPKTRDYKSTLYAMYPASAATNEQHHSYYNAQFISTNEPLMVGYYDSDDDNNSFVFKNLCSVLSFTMPNTEDFDYYIFSGNNNEKVGYNQYAAVYAQYSNGSEKFRQGGSYDSSVTDAGLKSISGPVVCDGSTLNNIYIPGLIGGPSSGISFTKGFTIEFVKDGDVTHKVSTQSSVSLAVGDYMPLGDISEHLKAASRPAHVSDLSSTEDLSATAKGPANCYVVNAGDAANNGKVFKFRQYKGNTTTSIGRVYDVEVLWETFNNGTTPNAKDIIAQVDYDSDFIYFKMPDSVSAGNALIAAKNILGEVLWSWHIWVPSSAFTSSTYGGVSHVQMMSRNLGALCDAVGDADTDVPIGSYGLFYVWGRKDPFPGPGALASNTAAAVVGTVNNRGMTSSTEIYKYPNSFVATGNDDSDAYKDWSTDHSSSLWGASKTVNDPCPPGWKVPAMSADVGGLWDSKVSSKTGLAGFAKNTTHHWIKFGVDYDGENPTTTGYVYFPYAGYMAQNNASYQYVGSRLHVWSASNQSTYFAQIVYAASDPSYVSTQRKGRGGNVRCVAE